MLQESPSAGRPLPVPSQHHPGEGQPSRRPVPAALPGHAAGSYIPPARTHFNTVEVSGGQQQRFRSPIQPQRSHPHAPIREDRPHPTTRSHEQSQAFFGYQSEGREFFRTHGNDGSNHPSSNVADSRPPMQDPDPRIAHNNTTPYGSYGSHGTRPRNNQSEHHVTSPTSPYHQSFIGQIPYPNGSSQHQMRPPVDNSDNVSMYSTASAQTANSSQVREALLPFADLEKYRQTVKKSQNPKMQLDFAKQLIAVSDGFKV